MSVGLILSLPVLSVGFTHDDLVHRLWLEGALTGPEVHWSRLYDFTRPPADAKMLVQHGLFPWFAHPELSLRFLRPLTSATLALDHALFGRSALLAHLHSLLWFSGLFVLASRLYLRWFQQRAAVVTTLVFGISSVHAFPTAWLASRHTLIAATLGALALWCWARLREAGWRPGGWLGAAALGLSLFASEAALVNLVFLGAYEAGTRRGLRQRLLGALPFALLGLGYLVVNAALGYGAKNSAMYVSPLSQPGEYLGLALMRVPSLMAELFGGVPAMLASADARVAPALAVWGLLTFAALSTVLARSRQQLEPEDRATLLWLACASLLSLGLLVGTPTTGRVLPMPLLGAAPVVAHALLLLWNRVRERRPRRWGALALLVGFAVLHGLVSPFVRLVVPLAFGDFARKQRQMAESAELGRCDRAGRVYLLTGADPTLSLYFWHSLRFYTPEREHERVRVVSMAPQDQRLTRLGDRSFELEVLGAERRTTDFEQLYRPADEPLQVGQAFRAEELGVTVLEVRDGLMTRARFQLEPQHDARACFAAWRNGQVRAVVSPEVGKHVLIPHEPGPMGM